MVLERFKNRFAKATGLNSNQIEREIDSMLLQGISKEEIFRRMTTGSGNGPQHATNPWYRRNIREGEKKATSHK